MSEQKREALKALGIEEVRVRVPDFLRSTFSNAQHRFLTEWKGGKIEAENALARFIDLLIDENQREDRVLSEILVPTLVGYELTQPFYVSFETVPQGPSGEVWTEWRKRKKLRFFRRTETDGRSRLMWAFDGLSPDDAREGLELALGVSCPVRVFRS